MLLGLTVCAMIVSPRWRNPGGFDFLASQKGGGEAFFLPVKKGGKHFLAHITALLSRLAAKSQQMVWKHLNMHYFLFLGLAIGLPRQQHVPKGGGRGLALQGGEGKQYLGSQRGA